MLVLETEHTRGVCVIASTFSCCEVLTGNIFGEIHLWNYTIKIRSYVADRSPIVFISCLDTIDFLSVNKNGTAVIWKKDDCSAVRTLSLICSCPDSFAILPTNLLAVSKYHLSPASTVGNESIDIWDLETGIKLHEGIQNCSGGEGILLAVTTAGYLVAASDYDRKMCVWKINKSDHVLICGTAIGRIFSLASLPTDEIVTAAHNIVLYKLTPCGEIYTRSVIEHRNIIDIIIPVAGYKFLTVDRARDHSGVQKLWNYTCKTYEYLGHSRNTGFPQLVLAKHNVIFSYKKNKLFAKNYYNGILRFSKSLAEIRKNVRILAQAERTETSLFVKLPIEIKMKIALMTATNMNKDEKCVSEEFAWSHFCRPHIYEGSYRRREKVKDLQIT